MKRLVTGITLVAASVAASPLLAGPRSPIVVRSVPEIDASTGVLAIAAVFAVVALVAERRRRAQ